MNVLDTLKGKQLMVMTDMKVEVKMTIDHIEERCTTKDLEESTKENDWYPPRSVNVVDYVAHFTNGTKKQYDLISDIDYLE